MIVEERSPEEQKFFETRGEETLEVNHVEKNEQPKVNNDQLKSGVEPEIIVEEKEIPVDEKKVPLAALHEERKRRQEETKARQDIQSRYDNLIASHAESARIAQQNINLPNANIPNPEQDPVAFLNYVAQQKVEELQKQKDNQISDFQRQQQEQFNNRVSSTAQELEREFMQETPDYVEASEFLKNSRIKELNRMGYDQDKINEMLPREITQLAANALSRGINPAQMAYNIAIDRGYLKKDNTNEQKESADLEKITRIAAGQKESRSIGSVSGTSPSALKGVDAKAIGNMSETEYSNFMDKKDRDSDFKRSYLGD
jgi:hypothetical protein